ncbi:hypothetical protein [Catellatospora sp. TT07R-123]|uniref:magnesium chelatase subunit ChlI family protein n=1 Tax=Catellatospora sp. TT07R-123 TaxID=2733863 RepID=UPI001FD39A49|nr:hypothetical protein [Catellatospora sp. TT07R-123]
MVAARVAAARGAAVARWAGELEVRTNAEVPGTVLRRRRWKLPDPVTAGLRVRLDRGELSARGFDRVLRMAWTVADLSGLERPGEAELNIALELRRGSWQ